MDGRVEGGGAERTGRSMLHGSWPGVADDPARRAVAVCRVTDVGPGPRLDTVRRRGGPGPRRMPPESRSSGARRVGERCW